MTSLPTSTLPETLPDLREDLRLAEGPRLGDGSPSWTIQDPVTNTFYRIGWLEFELLTRWHLGTPERVLAATTAETLLSPETDELAALLEFLMQNHLLTIRSAQYTTSLLAQARRSKLNVANWLLHHYLFFRIPLWHPERWLARCLPHVQWIYQRSTALAVGALALLGLILTYRQIDLFKATFLDTLTPSGFMAYALALIVTKSLHEMGHAFTATRYGVRVAHMGVAFLVMWPMLYTDTGESWRLKDARQRLAISSAGIITELSIAAIATLAWNLTPDGPMRQALFFLATTSWVLSLTINASPFMRFDGYFILSDILDMPNLHERTSAQARAWMRHHLLGWDDLPEESFPPSQRRALIAFALVTWIYRLVVFLGIALLVYHYFFKLLGIILFVVELAWFVIRPIYRELAVWLARRHEIGHSHRRRGFVILAIAFLGLLIPFDWSIRAPAWAHAAQSQVIYSPFAARVVGVDAVGGPVGADQLLLHLESPDAELRTEVAAERRQALERQLAGLAALPEGEAQRASIQQQEAMRKAEIVAGNEDIARLSLKAPFAGILSDTDPDIRPGVWVSPRQPLGVVWAPGQWIAEAFVQQEDLPRLRVGSTVRYYPESEPIQAYIGQILDVENFRLHRLPEPMLASHYGGAISTLKEGNNDLAPSQSLYRIRIQLSDAPSTHAMQRGAVVIEALPESWGLRLVKSLLAALIREAGF